MIMRVGEVAIGSSRVGVDTDGQIYVMFLDNKGVTVWSSVLGRSAAQWLASELFRAVIRQEDHDRAARVAAEEKLASK